MLEESYPTSRCVWPLPMLGGSTPAIATSTSTYAELAYAPPAARSVPVIAIDDGIVAFARSETLGHAVLVDHENGWATYYANLRDMVPATTLERLGRLERVKCGDVLGHLGTGREQALHFELWRAGPDRHYTQLAPRDHLQRWPVLSWMSGQTARVA